MEMLSDTGSTPVISTMVSTIWVAFTARIVVIYYQVDFDFLIEYYHFFYIGLHDLL